MPPSGRFLAGQTWTNFMYVPALPETVDFGGPVGQIFDRQAQVRWTQAFDSAGALGGGAWSVALENPESVVTLPSGASFRADDDHVPDLTGQVLFRTSRGKFALSGLLRQIRASAAPSGVVDQALGSAVNVAAVVPTAGKNDFRFLEARALASAGIPTASFPTEWSRPTDRFVCRDNGCGTQPTVTTGATTCGRTWCSPVRESNPAETPSTANKATQSIHANLIWSPVANTDLGVEYIHATRETEDGQSGHLNRIQASAKYVFSVLE